MTIGSPTAAAMDGPLCGILVTYQPEEARLSSALGRAAGQLDRLLVVDNSIDASGRERVDRALGGVGPTRNGQRPELLPRAGNIGLSRALNVGLRAGLREGYGRFLLLDQDSELEPGCAEALRRASARLSGRPGSAELAAQNVEERPTGLQARLEEVLYGYDGPGPAQPRPAALAMTSGLLVTVESLRSTGLFDESLFLDAVDHEFCLRSGSAGVPLYVAPDARIRHALGRPVEFRAGPVAVEVRQADEGRLYFSTRDTLRVARRHVRRWPFVCTTMFGFVASRTVVYGLLARSHGTWFRAICRGWTDFLRTPDRPQIPRLG